MVYKEVGRYSMTTLTTYIYMFVIDGVDDFTAILQCRVYQLWWQVSFENVK